MSDFELLIATRNLGKQRELEVLLAPLAVRIHTLAEFPAAPEVEEKGSTFLENAGLKASTCAGATGLWTLGEDSGLEVEALGGAPGVLSARYAGRAADDSQRITRLLADLAATGNRERRARFLCAISIANPYGQVAYNILGTCEGHIADFSSGTNGFGYDPIFVPRGYTRTFGELPDTIKDKISHRARAMEPLKAYLADLVNSA